MKHSRVKKILSIFFTVIYLQVNVAWSALPSMPIPLYACSIFIHPLSKIGRIKPLYPLQGLTVGQPAPSANLLVSRWWQAGIQGPLSFPLAVATSLLARPARSARIKDKVFIFHQNGVNPWPSLDEDLLNPPRQNSGVPLAELEDEAPADAPDAPRAGDRAAAPGRDPGAAAAAPAADAKPPINQERIDQLKAAKNNGERGAQLAEVVQSFIGKAGNPTQATWGDMGVNDLLGTDNATTYNTLLAMDPKSRQDMLANMNDNVFRRIGLRVEVVRQGGQNVLRVFRDATDADIRAAGLDPARMVKKVNLDGRTVMVRPVVLLAGPKDEGLVCGGQTMVSINKTTGRVGAMEIELRLDAIKETADKRADKDVFKAYMATLRHEAGHAFLYHLFDSKLSANVKINFNAAHEYVAMWQEMAPRFNFKLDGNEAKVSYAGDNKQFLADCVQNIWALVDNKQPGGEDHKAGAKLVWADLVKQYRTDKGLAGNVIVPLEKVVEYLNGATEKERGDFFTNAMTQGMTQHIGEEIDKPKGNKVTDVRDLALEIEANITGGDVKFQWDDAAGDHRFIGNGVVQFEGKNKDFTGTAVIKDGKIVQYTFQAVPGKTATVDFENGQKLNLRPGQHVSINVQTKEITAASGRPEDLEGLQVVMPGGSPTVTYMWDPKNPAVVRPFVDEGDGPKAVPAVHLNNGNFELAAPDEDAQFEPKVVNPPVRDKLRIMGDQFGGIPNTYKEKPGTVFRRDERGRIHLEQGRAEWRTQDGFLCVATREKGGPLNLTVVADMDIGPEGKVLVQRLGMREVARTTFFARGEALTFRDGELVSYKASTRKGIQRDVIMPQSRQRRGRNGQEQKQDPKPMADSMGKLTIREGRVDSVWINGKDKNGKDRVILETMTDNVTGHRLANGNAAGEIKLTNEGRAMFKVSKDIGVMETVSGLSFNRLTGQSAVKVNVHFRGEVAFKVERGGPGGSGPNRDHKDRDVDIISLGGGKYKKVAVGPNALSAANFSLGGGLQHVKGDQLENVRIKNKSGETIAVSLDKVKVTVLDEQNKGKAVEGINFVAVLSREKGDLATLKELNVYDLPVISILRNFTEASGHVVLKGKDVVDAKVLYKMGEDGSRAFLNMDARTQTLTMTGVKDPTRFNLGPTAITVPGGSVDNPKVVTADLRAGTLQRSEDGTYEHVDGVKLELNIREERRPDGSRAVVADTVVLRYDPAAKDDPASGGIRVESVSLQNDGHRQFGAKGATYGVQLAQKDNPERGSAAVFSGGRVWFRLENDLEMTGQNFKLAGDVTIREGRATARYLSVDFAGRQSVSAEIVVGGLITLPKSPEAEARGGAADRTSAGLTTPGAVTRAKIGKDAEGNTTIDVLSGPDVDNSVLAAIITETGKFDPENGDKPILIATPNLMAQGSELEAGRGNLEIPGVGTYEEGLKIKIGPNQTIEITGTTREAKFTATSGDIYTFLPTGNSDNPTRAESGPSGFKVLDGAVRYNEAIRQRDGITATGEGRQLLLTPNGGVKLEKEGRVEWVANRDVETPADLGNPDGGRVWLTAGTRVVSRGNSLDETDVIDVQGGYRFVDADPAKLLEKQNKARAEGGRGPLVEGLTLLEGSTAREVTWETGRGKQVVHAGDIRVKVDNKGKALSQLNQNDAGLVLSADGGLSLNRVPLSAIDLNSGYRLTSGTLTLQGDKKGTVRQLGNGTEETVIRQRKITFTAGQDDASGVEELSVLRGQKGQEWQAPQGTVLLAPSGAACGITRLSFTENSTLMKSGNRVWMDASAQAGSHVRATFTDERILEHNLVLDPQTNKPTVVSSKAGREVSLELQRGADQNRPTVTADYRVIWRGNDGLNVKEQQNRADFVVGVDRTEGKFKPQTAVQGTETARVTLYDAQERPMEGQNPERRVQIGDHNYRMTATSFEIEMGQQTPRGFVGSFSLLQFPETQIITPSGQVRSGTIKDFKYQGTGPDASSRAGFTFELSGPESSRDLYHNSSRDALKGRVIETSLQISANTNERREVSYTEDQHGFVRGDDGRTAGFIRDGAGLRLVDPNLTGFTLLGNQVQQVRGEDGNLYLKTELTQANLGRAAISLNNKGFSEGIVAWLPAGTTLVNASHRNFRQVQVPITVGENEVLSLRLTPGDSDGPAVYLLTSDVSRENTVQTTRRAGSDGTVRNQFVIEAGSVFVKDKDTLSLVDGSLRVDRGGALVVGEVDHVNVMQGGAGGAPGPKTFVRFRDEGGMMVMTQGRTMVSRNKDGESQMMFKPGTIFINDGIQERYVENGVIKHNIYGAERVRVLDDKGRFNLAVQTQVGGVLLRNPRDLERARYQDIKKRAAHWEIQKDKVDRSSRRVSFDGMATFERWTDQEVRVIVLDGDFNEVGTYSVGGSFNAQGKHKGGELKPGSETDSRSLANGSYISKQSGFFAKYGDNQHLYRSQYSFSSNGEALVITEFDRQTLAPTRQLIYNAEGNLLIDDPKFALEMDMNKPIVHRYDAAQGNFTDPDRKDGYDPYFKWYGLTTPIRESSVGYYMGAVVMVGAIALAPFTGGTSLGALALVGTLGFFSGLASYERFRAGDDIGGAVFLLLAFLPMNGLSFAQAGKALTAVRTMEFGLATGLKSLGNTVSVWKNATTIAQLWNGGKNILAGGFNLYLHLNAASAIYTAVDTYKKEGWSDNTKAAVQNALWQTAVAAVGYAGPLIGAGLGKLGGVLGGVAGAMGKYGAAVTFLTTNPIGRGIGSMILGAGAGAAYHYATGQEGSVWNSVAKGAIAGLALYLSFQFGKALNTWSADKIAGFQKAAEALGTGFSAQKLWIGVVKFGVELLRDVALYAGTAGIGTLVGLSYSGMDAFTGRKDFAMKDVLAYTFVGALLGGALMAAANWGNAIKGMGVGGYTHFTMGRIQAGLVMAIWEVLANSFEFKGGADWAKPWTWANGIQGLVNFYTDSYGLTDPQKREAAKEKDTRTPLQKGIETFLFISALHPFFGLGRPGVNPITRPLEGATSLLSKAGLSRTFKERVVQKIKEGAYSEFGRKARLAMLNLADGTVANLGGAAAFLAKNVMVTPLNIKTFEIFELASVKFAEDTGWLEKTGTPQGGEKVFVRLSDGELVQENFKKGEMYVRNQDGQLVRASYTQKAIQTLFSTLGFLNAPIHASKDPEKEFVQKQLASAQRWSGEGIPLIGRLIGALRERTFEGSTAEDLVRQINSSKGQEGDGVHVQTVGPGQEKIVPITLEMRRAADQIVDVRPDLLAKPSGNQKTDFIEQAPAGDRLVADSTEARFNVGNNGTIERAEETGQGPGNAGAKPKVEIMVTGEGDARFIRAEDVEVTWDNGRYRLTGRNPETQKALDGATVRVLVDGKELKPAAPQPAGANDATADSGATPQPAPAAGQPPAGELVLRTGMGRSGAAELIFAEQTGNNVNEGDVAKAKSYLGVEGPLVRNSDIVTAAACHRFVSEQTAAGVSERELVQGTIGRDAEYVPLVGDVAMEGLRGPNDARAWRSLHRVSDIAAEGNNNLHRLFLDGQAKVTQSESGSGERVIADVQLSQLHPDMQKKLSDRGLTQAGNGPAGGERTPAALLEGRQLELVVDGGPVGVRVNDVELVEAQAALPKRGPPAQEAKTADATKETPPTTDTAAPNEAETPSAPQAADASKPADVKPQAPAPVRDWDLAGELGLPSDAKVSVKVEADRNTFGGIEVREQGSRDNWLVYDTGTGQTYLPSVGLPQMGYLAGLPASGTTDDERAYLRSQATYLEAQLRGEERTAEIWLDANGWVSAARFKGEKAADNLAEYRKTYRAAEGTDFRPPQFADRGRVTLPAAASSSSKNFAQRVLDRTQDNESPDTTQRAQRQDGAIAQRFVERGEREGRKEATEDGKGALEGRRQAEEQFIGEVAQAFHESAFGPGLTARERAEAKGQAVRDFAEANRGVLDADFLRRLVLEIDFQGCSVCFVQYSPERLADTFSRGFDRARARVVNPGNARLHGRFAVDLMWREVYDLFKGSRADLDVLAASLGRAADGIRNFNSTDARMMDDLALKLRTGGQPTGLNLAVSWARSRSEYHRTLLTGLNDGKSMEAAREDAREVGKEYFNQSGFGGRLQALKEERQARWAEVRLMKGESRVEARQMVRVLDRLIKDLEAKQKTWNPDALDTLVKAETVSEFAGRMIGSDRFDRSNREALKKEIVQIGNEDVRNLFQALYDKIESQVTAAAGAPDQKFFERVWASAVTICEKYKLGTEYKNPGDASLSGNIRTVDGMLDGSIGFAEGVKKIFNKDIAKLDIGERLALEVAVKQRFFQTYSNGIRQDHDAQAWNKIQANDAKPQNQYQEGRRVVLLLEFMLQRTVGLEAAGGKSPIFILGLADHAMRAMREGEGRPIELVGELVVFGEAEVEKYLGEYAPLFRAFGMKPVAGRNLASEDPITRKRALDAFRPEKGVVKIVCSDFFSRGFLERLIRATPNSELAILIKTAAKLLGIDEMDASFLSRMSFISSDGNLVANGDQLGRAGPIGEAILQAVGGNAWDYGDRTKSPVYRKFLSREASQSELERGEWYSNIDGEIVISKPLLAKVEALLKGKEYTTYEIQQGFRAFDAVGNSDAFGFFRGADDKERNLRPTHKRMGAPQHGQIDSSVTFNILAVKFENKKRNALLEKGVKDLSRTDQIDESDVKLSDAGSMATFVQVVQSYRSRPGGRVFAATGTTEGLKDMVERVLGLRVVDVEASSYKSFASRGLASFDQAYAYERDLTGGTGKRLDYYALQEGESQSNLAGRAIRGSLEGVYLDRQGILVHRDNIRAGILIGSPKQASLKEGLYGFIEQYGGSEKAKLVGELRKDSSLSIRGAVERATKWTQDNGDKGLYEMLVRHVRVIDGTERSDLVENNIVKRASIEKLVVFATEVGLRALSYDAKDIGRDMVDLLLMGTEEFSTEANLQAFARVDRGDERGARRVVIVNRKILENRVAAAKHVQEWLQAKKIRPAGWLPDFARDYAAATNKAADGKFTPESMVALVELAGDFGSKEAKAQSALFFINEQTSSKLVKEPLQGMLARETTEKGKKALDDIYHDVLSHSDRSEMKQGTLYRDPADIVYDAFMSGAKMAHQVLGRIASSREVSFEIRLEALERMADLTDAAKDLKGRLARRSADGSYSKQGDYAESAYANVAENSRGRPADMVARVSVTMADFILPNTQKGENVSGARGSSEAVTVYTRTGNGARSGNVDTVDGLLDSLDLTEKTSGAAPRTGGTEKILDYDGQVAVQLATGYRDWSEPVRARHVAAAHALGFLDDNFNPADPNAARDFAREVHAGWVAAGGKAKDFDMDAMFSVTEKLVETLPVVGTDGAAAGGEHLGRRVDASRVVDVVMTPDKSILSYKGKKKDSDQRNDPSSRGTHRTEALALAIAQTSPDMDPDVEILFGQAGRPGGERQFNQAARRLFGRLGTENQGNAWHVNPDARRARMGSLAAAMQWESGSADQKLEVASRLKAAARTAEERALADEIELTVAELGCHVCLVGTADAQRVKDLWLKSGGQISLGNMQLDDWNQGFAQAARQAIADLKADGNHAAAQGLQEFAGQAQQRAGALAAADRKAKAASQEPQAAPSDQRPQNPHTALAWDVIRLSEMAQRKELDQQTRSHGVGWMGKTRDFVVGAAQAIYWMWNSPDRAYKKLIQKHTLTAHNATGRTDENSAMVTLGLLGLKGGQEDLAREVLQRMDTARTRPNAGENDPITDLYSDLSAGDILSVVARSQGTGQNGDDADPGLALANTIEAKKAGFLFRPIALQGKQVLKFGSMAVGVVATIAGSYGLAVPIVLGLLAVAFIMKIGSYTFEDKGFSLKEKYEQLKGWAKENPLKSAAGAAGLAIYVLPKVLPYLLTWGMALIVLNYLAGKVAPGLERRSSEGQWGMRLGRQLGRLPGIGDRVGVSGDNAFHAASHIKKAGRDIEQEKWKALETPEMKEAKKKWEKAKDDFKKQPAEKQASLQDQYTAERESYEESRQKKQDAVPGMTLGRLADSIMDDSTIPEEEKPEVLRLALVILGMDQDKAAALVGKLKSSTDDKAKNPEAKTDFELLQDFSIDELKDEEMSIGDYLGIARFEESLGDSQPVTAEAVNQKTEPVTVGGETKDQVFGVDAKKVREFYAGGEVSDAEWEAIGVVESDLGKFRQNQLELKRYALTTDDTSGRQRPHNAAGEVLGAIRGNTVPSLYADALQERADQAAKNTTPDADRLAALARAGRQVADGAHGQLQNACQRLLAAGVPEADVRKFQLAAIGQRSMAPAVQPDGSVRLGPADPIHRSLEGMMSGTGDNKDKIQAAVADVARDLQEGYFGELTIGMAAFREGLNEQDIGTLSHVSNVNNPFGGGNWAERKPYYQAMSAFRLEQAAVTMRPDRDWDVFAVVDAPDGRQKIPVGRIHRENGVTTITAYKLVAPKKGEPLAPPEVIGTVTLKADAQGAVEVTVQSVADPADATKSKYGVAIYKDNKLQPHDASTPLDPALADGTIFGFTQNNADGKDEFIQPLFALPAQRAVPEANRATAPPAAPSGPTAPTAPNASPSNAPAQPSAPAPKPAPTAKPKPVPAPAPQAVEPRLSDVTDLHPTERSESGEDARQRIANVRGSLNADPFRVLQRIDASFRNPGTPKVGVSKADVGVIYNTKTGDIIGYVDVAGHKSYTNKDAEKRAGANRQTFYYQLARPEAASPSAESPASKSGTRGLPGIGRVIPFLLIGIVTLGLLAAGADVSQAGEIASTVVQAASSAGDAMGGVTQLAGTSPILAIFALGIAVTKAGEAIKNFLAARGAEPHGNLGFVGSAPINPNDQVSSFVQDRTPWSVKQDLKNNVPGHDGFEGFFGVPATPERDGGKTLGPTEDRPIVKMRRVVLDMEQPTQAVQDMAYELAQIRGADPRKGVDEDAVGFVRDLLSQHPVAGNINVRALLTENGFDLGDIQSEYGIDLNARGIGTLRNVSALEDDGQVGQFKNFVYQLVAFNGDSVSTWGGDVISSDMLKWMNQNGYALLHTHPGTAKSSAMDRITAWRIGRFTAEEGLASMPLLIGGADGSLAVFSHKPVSGNITDIILKSPDPDRARVAARRAEGRTLVVASAPQTPRSPFERLKEAVFSAWSWAKEVGQRAEPVPIIDKQEASVLVRLAGAVTPLGVTERREVLNVFSNMLRSQDQNAHQMSVDDLRLAAGPELVQVLLGIEGEMRGLATDGALRQMVSEQKLPALVSVASRPYFRQFNVVSALPQSREAAVDFVLEELNGPRGMLAVMTSKGAEKEARELEREVASYKPDDILKPLRILAEMSENLVHNLNDASARTGTRVDPVQFRHFMNGEKAPNPAQLATVLYCLRTQLNHAIFKGTGKTFDDQFREHLEQTEIVVIDMSNPAGQAKWPAALTGKKAGIVEEDKGGKRRIYIAYDEHNPDVRGAFVGVLEEFAHEWSHPFANQLLSGLAVGSLGVPTLYEELVSTRLAVMALRELGLNEVATIMQLETAKQVVKMRKAKAEYLNAKDIIDPKTNRVSAKDAEKLLAAPQDSEGLNSPVIVTQIDAQYKALSEQFNYTGVRVVRAQDILQVPTESDEAPIQAHARRYFGAAAFFITNQTPKDIILLKLVSAESGIPRGLLVNPVDGKSLVDMISEVFMNDRYIKRQA